MSACGLSLCEEGAISESRTRYGSGKCTSGTWGLSPPHTDRKKSERAVTQCSKTPRFKHRLSIEVLSSYQVLVLRVTLAVRSAHSKHSLSLTNGPTRLRGSLLLSRHHDKISRRDGWIARLKVPHNVSDVTSSILILIILL